MRLRAILLLVVSFALVQFGCGLLLGAEFSDAELAPLEAGAASACVPIRCTEQVCGRVPDGCGGLLECGGCADPTQECKAGVCACRPAQSCVEVGAACNITSNGCSGVLDCGPCTGANQRCTDNQCACQPTACGARCGEQSDGCNQVVLCAACPDGQNCGGGGADLCGAGVCNPIGCDVAEGRRCGKVSNGCGVIIDCAGCTAPETCGGGGVAGVCGCVAKTCPQLGATCGSVDNGCGVPIDCGACTAPESCAGAGTPNRCGCSPKSCAEQNRECGPATDLCGRDLGQCGPACPGGLVCNAQGRCAASCPRPTQAEACAGKCGTVADPCGGPAFECGSSACSNDTVCVGNTCTCPAAPACTPGACQPTSNRCGSTRECLACDQGLDCLEGNYCGCGNGGDECGPPDQVQCCSYYDACYTCPWGDFGCYDPRGSPPSGCN